MPPTATDTAGLAGLAARIPRTKIAGWTLLVAAVALAYGWTLRAHFVSDDFGLVGHFTGFPWSAWPDLFFRDWSYDIWAVQMTELRPIAALTFIVDGRLWGTDPAGFHLTNVLLHLACSALVILIALEVLDHNRTRALAAGLLFALHPVAGGAVVWVTGRVELLSALGLLTGFLAFLRYRGDGQARWLVLGAGAFAFGVFAKESCLLLPGIALVHDAMFGSWRRGRRSALAAPYAAWAAVLAVYVYCRSFGMDAIVTAPLVSIGLLGLAQTLAERVIPYAAAMFLAPDILLRLRPIVEPYSVAIAVAGIAAVAGVSAWLLSASRWRDRSRRVGLFYALMWPALTAAPLMVTYLTFRHLYPATAGFAIGVAAVLARRFPQGRGFAAVAAGVLTLCAGQLAIELPRFQAAAERSREISGLVQRVARTAEPGDVLVLDVSGRLRNTLVWAGASPFALRPPFVSRNLPSELVVVERPAVYREPLEWPSRGTSARLRAADGGGWLISAVDGELALQRLSSEALEAMRQDEALADPEMFADVVAEMTEPQ